VSTIPNVRSIDVIAPGHASAHFAIFDRYGIVPGTVRARDCELCPDLADDVQVT
jgi:hypothetical protein